MLTFGFDSGGRIVQLGYCYIKCFELIPQGSGDIMHNSHADSRITLNKISEISMGQYDELTITNDDSRC